MTDRGWFVLGLALASMLAPGAARADGDGEGEGDGRSRAGIAVGAVVPIGDWAEATGPAGAASIWLEVPVSPATVITARVGAIVHAPATITLGARASLIEVPVLGGARFAVGRAGPVRVRLGGDVGLVVAHQRVTLRGVTDTDTGLRFGAALALGVAVDRYGLEVGPWLADLTDLDRAVGVGATLSVRLRAW